MRRSIPLPNKHFFQNIELEITSNICTRLDCQWSNQTHCVEVTKDQSIAQSRPSQFDTFFCLWHAVCLDSNYIRMTKSSDNIPSHPFSRNCWFCLPRVLTILKYQVLMGFYYKWSRHHLNGKWNRQSFSFQINCQVENKWCYFFTHQPLNSKHLKVNIHTWRCE